MTETELRQIDAQIYERVFGLPIRWTNDDPAFDYEADDMMMPTEPFDWLRRYGYDVPHFSEDIDAAWEVVEKMADRGWPATIDSKWGYWYCGLWPPRGRVPVGETARTAPLAICRCALKVVEERQWRRVG